MVIIKQNTRRIDDPLWKAILEQTFGYFLEFIFVDAREVLDLDAEFEFLDQELQVLFGPQAHNKGVRVVDKLVKVKRKDGGEQFIVCHIEVQSVKSNLEARMFEYFYRIYEKYKVPITAIAILADEQPGYRPQVFVQEFLGTKLTYRFNAYKILDQSEEELRANPNPFAVVVLTALLALKHKKASDLQLKDMKHDLYQEMLKREMPMETRQAIYDFLNRYINFENMEILNIFEKEIEKSLEINQTMGTREYLLEKARTEARMEERAIAAKLLEVERANAANQLEEERAKAMNEKRSIAFALKNLGIAIETIAKSTGLSVQEVVKLS